MATLDQHIQLPPPLEHETPPSVADLIAQIDRWVIYHLKVTVQSNVHFENQLYGVINSFHTSIFPLNRRFMVIPQALIRRAMEAGEVNEDLGNVSFGSTGGLHESREIPGLEAEKIIPDFIMVKVTPQPGLIRDHRIVCVVELKRDDVSEDRSVRRMFDYIDQIAQHPSRDENLRGYLIMANEVIQFTLDVNGVTSRGHNFDMFAAGDPFTKKLCEIAIRHWNN